MKKQIIHTSGNTGVAREIATNVAGYLLRELKHLNNTSSGRVHVQDDEKDFDNDLPIGRFILDYQAEVKITSKWLTQVLSGLQKEFDWTVEPRASGFLITTTPTNWGYDEYDSLLLDHAFSSNNPEDWIEAITWRVGS